MGTAWLYALALNATLLVQILDPASRAPLPMQTSLGAVRAPEGPRHYEGPLLTLATALTEASSRNPDILADLDQIDVTRDRPAQARALAPPTFETQIWQWPINTVNPANTTMYMFMATQELPGRGKRDLRAAVAMKDVDLAETDVVGRTRDTVARVKQAYAVLVFSRSAIDIHLESQELLRQFVNAAQATYATGTSSQQDVLKGVVELSKLHDDLIVYEQQEQLASAELNTLMGHPIDAPIGPLSDPDEQILVASIAQMEAIATAHRPEIRVARQQVERAQAELALAKQDRRPDFSVQGGYMLMPHQTDAWLGSIGVAWPNAPWARGKLDAHVKEMTDAVQTAEARERAVQSATTLALREAYLTVKAAEQRAALLRTTILPETRQALDASRIAYQTDRSSFLALLDNERMSLDVQLEYGHALGDFDRGIANLERVLGTDLTPDMLTVVGRTNGGDR